MNKKVFILLAIVLIVVFAIFVFFVLFPGSSLKIPPGDEKAPTFGTSTSTIQPVSVVGNNQGKTISIMTADGTKLQTKDFKNDPAMTKDRVNAGRYYLGFNLTEEPTKKVPYLIEYIEANDYFTIVLLQEPIGKSRTQMEQYLREHLGISQGEMCTVRHRVSVPYFVNQFYTGMSLGFSFCPGNVVLPE